MTTDAADYIKALEQRLQDKTMLAEIAMRNNEQLTIAFRAQQAQIAALEARLAALEAK